jgi:hypothetical protein
MKNFGLIAIAAVLSLGFAACSTPSDSVPDPVNADNYFFPRDRTFNYTYSLDSAQTSVTSTYLVRDTTGGFMILVDQNASGPINNSLYLFKQEVTPDGSTVCRLSVSANDNGFIALKGKLDLGANWYADDAHNIEATVVGKYAEYYLPGRQVHYNDVVVIKYADKNAASDHYIIRYFANGYGLILERTITGTSSESADLQLLSRQGNGSSRSNLDLNHDRWFNANGRYQAHMKDESDK